MPTPPFSRLAIDDVEYPVLAYVEQGTDQGPLRTVLLRLSEAERSQLLTQLPQSETYMLRPIGDPHFQVGAPVELAGGVFFWSRHLDDDGAVYYKQQLVFRPPRTAELLAEEPMFNSYLMPQTALADMTVRLEAKLHALAALLVQKGVLTNEEAQHVLGDGWKDLVSDDEFRAISREQGRIPDAEEAMPVSA